MEPPEASPAHLHGADTEASVNDELAEGSRALVAVPPMDHKQATEMLELCNGEVCGQGGLFSLLQPRDRGHEIHERQTWGNRPEGVGIFQTHSVQDEHSHGPHLNFILKVGFISAKNCPTEF